MEKPQGLFHQTRDFAVLKIEHFIILEHQKAFPELAKQMRNNPQNATNIYSAFLTMTLLNAKGTLTDDIKRKILTTYKVIK